MGLSTIQTIVHEGLYRLMHHCTRANEHVACSAYSSFLKEVFHALCKVYEVFTGVEQNFYVPQYFSSFINA